MIISAKADGVHCLLMMGQTTVEFLTEKSLNSHDMPENMCDDEYIIEVEIVGNIIYCYDLHMASG